ncbi:MAG: hypothetical protein AAGE52_13190 [Myxococcota bacterium]
MRHIQFIALLALGALPVVAGCSSDNYFCNDEGCFFCDGLGCREVEPPERPTCRGDFECPEGTMCTDLGCVAECDGDSDCPDGTECRAGSCVGPTEPDPDPRPGTCERNADCGDESLVCRDGMCMPDDRSCGEVGCSCEETGECSDGFVCLEGECRADEDVCRFNTECGVGRQCVDGACVEACGPEVPCETGTCVNGFCRDIRPPTGECTRDDQCDAGETCIDSSCVDTCMSDAECGEGRYCDGNRCRVDTRPRPFCTVDSECRFRCVNGVCRTPCDNSTECARVDVQFSICLEENYCATANEATTDCAISSDCADSEECIDGICR